MDRKLICLTALSLSLPALTGIALAQGAAKGAPPVSPPRPGGFAERGASPLIRLQLPAVESELKLTADQRTRIGAISKKLKEDLNALAKQAVDQPLSGQKLRELRGKADTDALAVLTPAQRKQFDSLGSSVQGFAELGRAGLALAAVSGVTADQKARLTRLTSDTGAKRQAIFKEAQAVFGNSGTEAQREAFQKKVLALDADTMAAVRKILNADQLKEFDEAAKNLGFGPRPVSPGS